jgi:hypothetical protein
MKNYKLIKGKGPIDEKKYEKILSYIKYSNIEMYILMKLYVSVFPFSKQDEFKLVDLKVEDLIDESNEFKKINGTVLDKDLKIYIKNYIDALMLESNEKLFNYKNELTFSSSLRIMCNKYNSKVDDEYKIDDISVIVLERTNLYFKLVKENKLDYLLKELMINDITLFKLLNMEKEEYSKYIGKTSI